MHEPKPDIDRVIELIKRTGSFKQALEILEKEKQREFARIVKERKKNAGTGLV